MIVDSGSKIVLDFEYLNLVLELRVRNYRGVLENSLDILSVLNFARKYSCTRMNLAMGYSNGQNLWKISFRVISSVWRLFRFWIIIRFQSVFDLITDYIRLGWSQPNQDFRIESVLSTIEWIEHQNDSGLSEKYAMESILINSEFLNWIRFKNFVGRRSRWFKTNTILRFILETISSSALIFPEFTDVLQCVETFPQLSKLLHSE